MWAIHNDPISWTNACAQIQRPMDRGFHAEILRNKNSQLLFVIINTVVGNQYEQDTSDQLPDRKLNPIGHLVLAASDPTSTQHCETTLSIGIHKDYQRQGYGSEAIAWALDWAFNYANMHRVGLSVYGWNSPAREMYLKIGFREEGRRRESLFLRGRYWDEILMSVLVQEWKLLRGLEDDN
ncbi:acetyltransferase (GNAT) family domain-containing protein [Cordyceps javanica]|nr:acetyltransferase (GNAT) family domain-containing protein [Cordyceps javanica]